MHSVLHAHCLAVSRCHFVAVLPSRAAFRFGLRLSLAGSPMHQAVSCSTWSCLWTGSSSPVAPHPVFRRRSYLQLRTASALPGRDSHPAVGVHSQAHEGAGPSQPRRPIAALLVGKPANVVVLIDSPVARDCSPSG